MTFSKCLLTTSEKSTYTSRHCLNSNPRHRFSEANTIIKSVRTISSVTKETRTSKLLMVFFRGTLYGLESNTSIRIDGIHIHSTNIITQHAHGTHITHTSHTSCTNIQITIHARNSLDVGCVWEKNIRWISKDISVYNKISTLCSNGCCSLCRARCFMYANTHVYDERVFCGSLREASTTFRM